MHFLHFSVKENDYYCIYCPCRFPEKYEKKRFNHFQNCIPFQLHFLFATRDVEGEPVFIQYCRSRTVLFAQQECLLPYPRQDFLSYTRKVQQPPPRLILF